MPSNRLTVTVEPETVERLRKLAASWGYVSRSGPTAGKGNISAFLDAIGREELLPPTEQTMQLLRDEIAREVQEKRLARDEIARVEKRTEAIVQDLEELKLQVAALRGETETE